MKKSDLQASSQLHNYLLSMSLRESPVLAELRTVTAKEPNAIMQITAEQGQFMALLVKMIGAKKTLEIGTYTGYSALSIALAMPDDSLTITCDINETWTNIAQEFWHKAGVANKIELKLGAALETLDQLLETGHEGSFDFAFIDADKSNYDGYYEKSLRLLRAGGVMAIDNVFLFGSVVDPALLDETTRARIADVDILAIHTLNSKIKNDKRVDISMLPVADGLTLVYKR